MSKLEKILAKGTVTEVEEALGWTGYMGACHLTKVEIERGNAFVKAHNKCRDNIRLCAGYGLGYSITITPNNIASSVEVKCTLCEKVKDITDIDSW